MSEHDAMLVQMYQSARAAETLGPAAFDRHFGHQRALLVQHAATTCPFYADRLANLRYGENGRIDPKSWLDVPVMSRLDLRDHFEAIKSSDPPERHGAITLGRTSGTSGMPVEILRTAMQRMMNVAILSRFYAWHDLDPRRNFVMISGDVLGTYPDGEKQPTDWMPAFLRDGPCGDTVRLKHPLEPEKQIEFLSRQTDCYLTTQPSNVLALATALGDMGADAPELRIGAIFTIGELVRDSHREAVRTQFGCEILDVYSGSETGTLACQCAEGRLHVNADVVHLEILRPDGTSAEPGETGRIIVTPLTAWASPLIRYDTGDLGRFGHSCPCGSTLPVLELAVGRDRNMFRFSDGSTVLGFVGLEKFRAFFPALQWQVAQTGPETLEIRYVSCHPEAAHDHDRVEREVSDYFGRPLSIQFVRLDAMPHGLTGKLPEAIREFE
mgnify:CR=1 FL=1